MSTSLYLSQESSATFGVPYYKNEEKRSCISKSALVRELTRSRALDTYHQALLDSFSGDPVVRLRGTGYGWWEVEGTRA